MIEIVNFIENEYCDELIKIHKQHCDTEVEPFEQRPYYVNGKFPDIEHKVEKICRQLSPLAQLETTAIVHWSPGSYMKPHYDHPQDLFAAILYLNDDYMGGQTCFDGIEIQPEKGKLFLFSSCGVKHWVNMVCESDRYTLGFWITKTNSNIYVPGINTR
tara:strand:+ start:192 stop:668 length:477 start_codon:yes stop_codon:yes gene_type:complete